MKNIKIEYQELVGKYPPLTLVVVTNEIIGKTLLALSLVCSIQNGSPTELSDRGEQSK